MYFQTNSKHFIFQLIGILLLTVGDILTNNSQKLYPKCKWNTTARVSQLKGIKKLYIYLMTNASIITKHYFYSNPIYLVENAAESQSTDLYESNTSNMNDVEMQNIENIQDNDLEISNEIDRASIEPLVGSWRRRQSSNNSTASEHDTEMNPLDNVQDNDIEIVCENICGSNQHSSSSR